MQHTIPHMCGRFASTYSPGQLQQWYDALAMPEFPLRYNIAPGTDILAVHLASDGCVGSMMRWGFIPSWAKDPATMPMLHNARAETIAERPMFRIAFRRRRCLIPASGFYEWKVVPGQRPKQPFYVSFKDGTPMSFAGIWATAKTADGTAIDTCAIITTSSNAAVEPIHSRMPVIIDRSDWHRWLQPEGVTDAGLQELLRPFDADRMQAWGVAHAVNRVTNDNPFLIQPIA